MCTDCRQFTYYWSHTGVDLQQVMGRPTTNFQCFVDDKTPKKAQRKAHETCQQHIWLQTKMYHWKMGYFRFAIFKQPLENLKAEKSIHDSPSIRSVYNALRKSSTLTISMQLKMACSYLYFFFWTSLHFNWFSWLCSAVIMLSILRFGGRVIPY
jgi:hypothetical protein